MLRLVVPPEPIVLPGDITSEGAADETVAAVIAAVTAAIDGPDGWLGRALGEQTIEIIGSNFHDLDREGRGIRLPCPPLIEVEAVVYLDGAGEEHVLDDSAYRLVGERLWCSAWPSVGHFPDAVKVRYRAGYNGTPRDETNGTGDVPENARQAIIISVQHLLTIGSENLFLSQDTVDGIGTQQFIVSENAGKLIERTCDLLLSPLRVWR